MTVSVSGPVAATVGPRVCQHRHRLGPRGGAQRHPVTGCGGDQLGHAGVGDDPAAADDDQVVGGVLQLAHQVAGDQHGPALGGQGLQEAAHPDDALGVHAVERLVEHQHRRVAEQRGGDAEPLPHAEREPAGLAPGRRAQTGLRDHLVDPRGAQALGVGQPEQVVAGGAAGLQRGRVEQRADVAQRLAQAGVRLPADRAVPASAASRPRMTRMVVDLPAPFGPTNPVTWPGATVNVMPSSAMPWPNRLRSPATSMVASMEEVVRKRPLHGPNGGRNVGVRPGRAC